MSKTTKMSFGKSAAKSVNTGSFTRKRDSFKTVKSPSDNITYLQRTIGNQAVQRLFKSGTIQTKLEIGKPNGEYEKEADRVADIVMRMPEPYCPTCREKGAISRKPEEEANPIQVTENGKDSKEIPFGIESSIDSLKGRGQSLPKPVKSYFEPRFGYDFGEVRVHTDATAAESAQAVNARAFTIGNNIAFASGQYSPETTGGKRLIAHELSHVLQQNKSNSKIIQREVQRDGIKMSSDVMGRIDSRINKADTHAKLLYEAMALVNILSEKRFFDPVNEAEYVAEAIANLVRLLELALEFNPGAAKDSPLNNFVYTCKCGWIDMGHLFFSALAAYAASIMHRFWPEGYKSYFGSASPSEVAMKLGYGMEILQTASAVVFALHDSLKLNLIPEDVKGMGYSAFTIEDLPSDQYGANLGQSIAKDTAATLTTEEIAKEKEELLTSPSIEKIKKIAALKSSKPYDISSYMKQFFTECGAIKANEEMIKETEEINKKSRAWTGGKKFSTEPYLLDSAKKICSM